MPKQVALLSLTALLAVPATILAHGGKTHVMGVVEKVEGRNIVVKDTTGKSVPVRVTPDTLYFVGKLKASRNDLKVGRRVAVDVFGMKGDYSALEVYLGVEEPLAEEETDP